jgi:hypothetical protein
LPSVGEQRPITLNVRRIIYARAVDLHSLALAGSAVYWTIARERDIRPAERGAARPSVEGEVGLTQLW